MNEGDHILVVKVDGGDEYGIRLSKEDREGHESVTVSDVTCADCSGPVTLFGIPDKVWNGLGLTTEWMCLKCVGRRLNPHCTADELSMVVVLKDDEVSEPRAVTPDEFSCVISAVINAEIERQRRKFKLKNINKYCGQKLTAICLTYTASFLGASTATADQVMIGGAKK